MAVTLVKNSTGDTPRVPGDDIPARITDGRAGSFFLVVPTRRKIRDAQRDLLHHAPGGTMPALRLFTLETLAAELCRLLVPPKRLLSPHMQAAFVQEAIRLKAGDLRYFRLRGPARRLPRGTLQKIAGVINRMKETGVYLSVLDEEIEEGEASERLKLRDIHAIYTAYEELTGSGGFIDPPGLFKEANLAWSRPGAEERFRLAHPEVNLLIVTGFDEFSDPEITLLHYLSEVPGLSTVITFDYHPDNDDLFGHLKENYRKFLANGFALSTGAATGRQPLGEHVARRLFSPVDGTGEKFDADGLVSVHAATDRLREVELIAKIIKTTLADTPGIGPGDICVCMPKPELYSGIFREVFEEAGVPANITDRFYLDQSAVVNGVLSLLLIAQNNFRVGDIMRAGTNPFLGLRSGPDRFDAPNILRTASELRTVSGRKRWLERIDGRIRFLSGERPRSDDARESDRREIERLSKAKKDLEGLARLVERLLSPMTPGEFSTAVMSLIDGLGIAGRIVSSGASGVRSEDVEREGRAYVEFVDFLYEFPEVLSLESPPGERRPLSYYLERFRPLLSQVRYNVRRRFGEGVLITSIDETRGLEFDVMIIAGAADGEFPSVYEPEVFLTMRRRQRRERYHLHGERYLFYQALTNFTRCVHITRPIRAGDVTLNPSGFLEALEEVARFRSYGPAPDGSFVPDPAAEVIVSPVELLERACMGLPADDPGGMSPELDQAMLAHIATAVAVEESRRQDIGNDAYRGIIGGSIGPAAARRLAERRHGTYSVTQLETYGDCPFRYFAGRQLRLRVTEKPEEGISPREMGRLLHEILFEFYSGRKSGGLRSLAGAREQEFRAAVDEIHAIARKKFGETTVDDIFWEIATEGVLGSPGRAGSLEAMLDAERNSDLPAEPAYFEVPFGRAGEDVKHRDPGMYSEEPVSAGDIRLEGKIDRIDLAGDAFRVIDYKTGSVLPGKSDIEDGLSLQLPLYLHCAETILAGRLGRPMSAGAGTYYHLRDGFRAVSRFGSADRKGSLIPAGERTKLFESTDRLREIVGAAISRAVEHAAGIADGRFPVRPSRPEHLCRSCEYRRVCRIRTRLAPEEGGRDPDTAEEVYTTGFSI